MLADTAGQIAARNFRAKLELAPKSDSSPVSNIDLEIERKIIDLITKKYP
jgi:fructose-1,6-bisphosphatase/inositol monophosphatase family enzyme